ncbi:MAG TPA: DegV family protein [Symbiobacteriaceae bacterium]|nr:DegV family protein [Symbiobacteriaceae bacterium]
MEQCLASLNRQRRAFSLKVKIVTDSTASIPADLCRALDITVIPCTIHFGSETFVDGVDPAAVLYARLGQPGEAPTTSTPSPGAFMEAYRKVAEGAAAVISIHVMETKSSLISTARMVAKMLPELPIYVVDSRTTTLGLGLLTLAAARLADVGHAAAEIVGQLERLIPHVDVHAAIADLTQLRRSGRVSLGQALVAGMLGIKPILYIGNSVAEVADRVRGWSRAVERMVEMALEKAGEARVHLAVVHTNAEDEARHLLEQVRHRFNCAEVLLTDAGTALATHAGPGAVGIVTMKLP